MEAKVEEELPKLNWLTRIAMMLGLGLSSHAARAAKTPQERDEEFEKFIRDRIPAECRGGDVLPLVFYPDQGLRKPSTMVTEFNEDILQLVRSMGTTMYLCGGVGLSAIQVGVPLRILVFVNPVVMSASEPVRMVEGCLSMPNVREMITRPSEIRVRAQTERGQVFETDLSGWPARVFLHELEHLDGGFFIDHLGTLERRMAEKKAAKLRRSVKLDEVNGKKRAAARAAKGRGR